MKRAVLTIPLLLALALTLSACSLQSLIPSTQLVSVTATPVPTAFPTVAPVDQSSLNAFDDNAGNCLDAANQAINLITQTAAGGYGGSYFNVDMRLDLQPHDFASGCADTAHITRYRQNVNLAQLTVWPLDSVWPYRGPVIRQQWLADVLNYLNKLYPKANVTIQVLYNGTQCGSASLGPGKNGTPQINATCF